MKTLVSWSVTEVMDFYDIIWVQYSERSIWKKNGKLHVKMWCKISQIASWNKSQLKSEKNRD